jgi:hypothetical protein
MRLGLNAKDLSSLHGGQSAKAVTAKAEENTRFHSKHMPIIPAKQAPVAIVATISIVPATFAW